MMHLKNIALLALLCLSVSACAGPKSKSSTQSSADAAISTAATAQDPLETFLQGCKTELETYCKDVTPGEGRILACIYAHGDKISGRCEYAMYDSAAQLERAVAALSYAVNECGDDLEKYCSSVEVGEGRLLACLEQHDKNVSGRCRQALKDVNLKK
ncbi:MAG: cysteine rich repeat-containing protein [Gammaproteobacteria bacterium]